MKMNAPGALPPHRLPVLTEVVQITDPADPMGGDLAEAEPPAAQAAGFPPLPVLAAMPIPAAPMPVPAPLRPAVTETALLTEQPVPFGGDAPAPPEWLKRQATAARVNLPLPAMAPPQPLPPDFSGSWWSRDEGPAVMPSAGPVPVPIPAPLRAPDPAPDDDDLVRRVMARVDGQVDMMFDHRLREAIAPALARAADGLMEDLREQLSVTLREMVSRAVAVELARLARQRETGS